MAIRGLQQKKAALGGLLHNDLACVTVSGEPQGRMRRRRYTPPVHMIEARHHALRWMHPHEER
jgi:hypothetical protein